MRQKVRNRNAAIKRSNEGNERRLSSKPRKLKQYRRSKDDEQKT